MNNRHISMIIAALALSSFSAHSSNLEVLVTNIKSDIGQIGCTLHLGENTFPMGDGFIQLWQPAVKGTVRCIFENVDAGIYAVAVSHDLNNNGITDTSVLGFPKENWGVSNNIRPRMRAPKFAEAMFQYPDFTSIEIKLD